MQQPTPPVALRASVYIKGATDQHIYGTNKEALCRRAIKLLTVFEPGFGNLWPSHYTIAQKMRDVSGNRADWKTVSCHYYKDVPEEQHDWRKRAAERSAKR